MSLSDKDRIFTNLYGFQSAGLKAAQARGDWDDTKALLAKGQDAIIEDVSVVAREAKLRLENLDIANAEAREAEGCGAGSSNERTRSAITSSLKMKLKTQMAEF